MRRDLGQRRRGQRRLGPVTLRQAKAWAGVVEREKKEEGVGRRAEQIGDEGAWGGSASWVGGTDRRLRLAGKLRDEGNEGAVR